MSTSSSVGDAGGDDATPDASLPDASLDGSVDSGTGCSSGYRQRDGGCEATCAVTSCGAHQTCDDSAGPPTCCNPHWSGAGCATCVVYVNGASTATGADGMSWATAYSSVQDGITAAAQALGSPPASGATCNVWVAEGTYYAYATAAADSFVLQPGVRLLGGFAGVETTANERDFVNHETVLSGTNGPLPAPHVFHVVTASNNSAVDGFTITQGVASDSVENSGGGVKVANTTKFVLANSRILENQASAYGAGVAINSATNTTIDNCEFIGNGKAPVTGGAMSVTNATGVAIGSTVFADNRANNGAGIAYQGSSGITVDQATFANNWGGALFGTASDVSLTRTVLAGNTGTAVAGSDGATLRLVNTLVTGSTTAYGGAISIDTNTSLTLDGVTCALNYASWAGGCLIAGTGTSTSITNSVFYGSPNVEVCIAETAKAFDASYSMMKAAYTCYSAGGSGSMPLPGDGMITDSAAEPKFAEYVTNGSTWTGATYSPATHTTTLTDTAARFTPGALVGKFVQVAKDYWWWVHPIIANSATTITVWGDVTTGQGDGTKGAAVGSNYTFADFRLTSASACIDSGKDATELAVDLTGWSRQKALTSPPAGAGPTVYPDMGAYEFHAPVVHGQTVGPVAAFTPTQITLFASESGGGALLYSITSGPTNGTLSAISGGTLTYTPSSCTAGSDSFTFTATDAFGATSAPATVSITLAAPAFAGGTGETVTPYLIQTFGQLSAVRCFLGASFQLDNDIDLANKPFAPVGSTATPYTGTFEGKGHVLSNWTYSAPSADYVGFFGVLHGATVKNLGIVNANVTGAKSTGILAGFGGLAGSCDSIVHTIDRCFTSGSVTGTLDVGGIVGAHGSGVVTNSYSTATVAGSACGVYNGTGGIVGTETCGSAHVANSYFNGRVVYKGGSCNHVGGVVGIAVNDCHVTSSFAAAPVTGGGAPQGVLGFGDSGWVTTSAYDQYISGVTTCEWGNWGGAPAKNDPADCAAQNLTNSDPAYFFNASNAPMKSWDFTTIWKIPSAGGYPVLRWQNIP